MWLTEFEKEAGYAVKDYTGHISYKEKLFRMAIHIPVGLFNVFCLYVGIVYGVLFFAGFFVYELNEDWRLKDGAYLDIVGWLWGFAIGVICLFVYNML